METIFKTDDGITIHSYDGDFFVRIQEYEKLLKDFKELKESHAILSGNNEGN